MASCNITSAVNMAWFSDWAAECCFQVLVSTFQDFPRGLPDLSNFSLTDIWFHDCSFYVSCPPIVYYRTLEQYSRIQISKVVFTSDIWQLTYWNKTSHFVRQFSKFSAFLPKLHMRRGTRRGSNGLANTIYWVTASWGGEAVLSKSWLAQNFVIFEGPFFNYITQFLVLERPQPPKGRC